MRYIPAWTLEELHICRAMLYSDPSEKVVPQKNNLESSVGTRPFVTNCFINGVEYLVLFSSMHWIKSNKQKSPLLYLYRILL